MFSIGSCDHFLSLKRKYPNLYEPYGYDWSLKEFGSLFVYDLMVEERPSHVVEFGAGYNTFFSDRSKALDIGYSTIDKSSEAGIGLNVDRFAETISKRAGNGHGHIDGFLGELGESAEENSADLICSVSVVEHITAEDMKKAALEARKILRPGGRLVNSVDTYHKSKKHLEWHAACVEAGFEVHPPMYHEWEFSGAHTTFLERQKIRYLIYNYLGNEDVLDSAIPYSSQFATFLHVAICP